jgi:hypothetical protein
MPAAIDELMRVHRDSVRDAYILGLETAAKDVCMYCGGRALGYHDAKGPNSAGNWTHLSVSLPAVERLCEASAAHARLRAFRCGRGKPDAR